MEYVDLSAAIRAERFAYHSCRIMQFTPQQLEAVTDIIDNAAMAIERL